MNKKNLIKFINETISSNQFDFLGLKEFENEEALLNTLLDFNFQKKFLYDLFFNNQNVKISISEGKIKKETTKDLNTGIFTVDYSAEIEYQYNGTDLELTISFSGESVDYKIDVSEKDGRKVLLIDWDSINCEIFSPSGDLVDFHIFEKVDEKIYRMFINKFIGYFIEKEIMD